IDADVLPEPAGEARAEPAAAEPGARHPADFVVLRAFLRIRQHVRRLRDLLHLFLGGLVIRVPVRVVAAGERAESALDLVGGRVFGNAEHLVEILLEPGTGSVHRRTTFTIAGRTTLPFS